MTIIARQPLPVPDSTVRLFPASQYTIEDLTNAYNQTRVDYLVPMPMNAARLAAYVKNYDVDMENSWVAMDGDEMLGLAMLGVRSGRTWLTRLGVLPARRRKGTGEALTLALLECTRQLGRPMSVLEVIKGNTPAYQLFQKVGFQPKRDLVVLRRPPGPPPPGLDGNATWLEKEEALDHLCAHPVHPAWTNELESYINAGDAQGLEIRLANGGHGWMVFRHQKFMLSHFVIHTLSGDPGEVTAALATTLYNRFPHVDTYMENVPVDDPQLPSLLQMGFFEVFRRIEMVRGSI